MSKLTLSVDDAVITQAKEYAKSQGMSVSEIVESYLAAISRPPASQSDAPILSSLRGTLKRGDVGEYHDYLEQKYL